MTFLKCSNANWTWQWKYYRWFMFFYLGNTYWQMWPFLFNLYRTLHLSFSRIWRFFFRTPDENDELRFHSILSGYTQFLNSLAWFRQLIYVSLCWMDWNYRKPTLIASCMRPQSRAFLAISLYETPGAYPSLSAISRATCSLSNWVCFTCSKQQCKTFMHDSFTTLVLASVIFLLTVLKMYGSCCSHEHR
jgi:hypothetical protein